MLKLAHGGFVLLALLLLCVGCTQEPKDLTAAPLGDRTVLEKLAEAYTEVSDEQLSVSPTSLDGVERKRFVEKVFARCGYSYGKTLHRMATDGVDKNNQLQVDMAELVLMPHRNPRIPTDLSDIYSGKELMDVAVVERQLNQ
jgi:hypothetical protein